MRKNGALTSEISDDVIESEVNFRTIAEQSPNIYFINGGGRFVFANKRYEETTRYTSKEFYSSKFDHITLTTSKYKELVSKNLKKKSCYAN